MYFASNLKVSNTSLDSKWGAGILAYCLYLWGFCYADDKRNGPVFEKNASFDLTEDKHKKPFASIKIRKCEKQSFFFM